MSERDHVARSEEAESGLPPEPFVPSAGLASADEAGFDEPLHVRALQGLPAHELARYRTNLALLAAGGSVRALLESGNMPLAGPGLYEALLTRSWAVRFRDKRAMIHFAEVAVEVARKLDPGAHGAKQVADLQARAWGELANAYRSASKLRSADHAFGQAFALFVQGMRDPYLQARLLDLEASLWGTWRYFPGADERFELAADLYRQLGETHLAGRAYVNRALYTFYNCRPEEALRLNQQALGLIDPGRDHALFLMAMHNDLLFLVDLRRYSEAKRRLFEARRHLIYEDRINALRLRAIEGRIEYGLKKLVSAETAFREVKEGMTQAGMSYPTALASLELAMVLLSLDRFEESEKEVLAARDIFVAVEVYREYLGSIVILEVLFRRREVTPAMIETQIAQIRRKELQVRPRHYE